MFKVIRKDSNIELTAERRDNVLWVNDEAVTGTLVKVRNGCYYAYAGNKVTEIHVLRQMPAEKKYLLLINGQKVEVEYQSKLDLLLKSMGFEQAGKNKAKNLTAPMPGMILDVKVEKGERVQTGDPILVLEAMKMENVLKAPGDAIIKELKVNKGDKVDKNQVMVIFE
jgi:acetyl/propionyl-CoA carboxylase alpha subunit